MVRLPIFTVSPEASLLANIMLVQDKKKYDINAYMITALACLNNALPRAISSVITRD